MYEYEWLEKTQFMLPLLIAISIRLKRTVVDKSFSLFILFFSVINYLCIFVLLYKKWQNEKGIALNFNFSVWFFS